MTRAEKSALVGFAVLAPCSIKLGHVPVLCIASVSSLVPHTFCRSAVTGSSATQFRVNVFTLPRVPAILQSLSGAEGSACRHMRAAGLLRLNSFVPFAGG
eukprot:RCo020341